MSGTTRIEGQPSIVGCGTFDNDEQNRFQLDLHKHDRMTEILLIEEGEGEFEIDGRGYTAGAGTLLFYQRGVWHKELSTKHPFRAAYIGFEGLRIKGAAPGFFFEEGESPIVRLQEYLPVVRKLMRDAIAEYRRNEPESETIANHYLGILFARLARLRLYGDAGERSRVSVKEAVQRARRMIEENYASPITLDALAAETYLNKYHLAHLFKAETGVSPIRFLIYCRMEAAKRYLITTDLLVKQIAELIGYQSEPSFYNIFLKAEGVTPGEFRRRSRS